VVEGLKDSERVGAVSFDVKTLSNSPKEQKTREQVEHSILVFVLNRDGKPLMPCTAGKARRLLKKGKAKVVNLTPFTIQLLYGSSGYKQDITLGIDAGYSKVGYSAITAGKELIAGELELRNDIKRLLEKRRAYRRERRSRKWYREPRFDNRCRKDGWLPPSLEHKLQSHIKLIERLKRILPIRRVVVEVASFDAQKMQNPEIKGVEYQQGELQGYEVREYLLEKWNRKCAYCGKANVLLEIEHIIPKSRGGSDRVSNLTISCHDCNLKKGNKTAAEFGHPEVQKQAKEPLKATAFMNAICWKLVNLLNCGWTYGGITKYNRTRLGLEKSHVNDAFVIAGGSSQKRSGYILKGKQVRRQNRSLYKANLLRGGRKKRNTIKEVNGFRRFDKVLYGKLKCFIFGLRSSGYFDLRDIEGNKIGEAVNSKKLRLVERARGRMEEVRRAIPPRPEGRGLLAPV
jgi:5-methylcytosine-specific restriction endonuclease McrA